LATSASKPVVFYTQVVSETQGGTSPTDTRTWPTKRIYQATEGSAPRLITTIGKPGEYPSEFMINDAGSKLYANLESSLVEIDVASGSRRTLYTADHSIDGVVFSPDEKSLVIWDQDIYAPSTDGKQPYKTAIISLDGTVISEQGSTTDKGYYPKFWNTDGTVAIGEAAGEATIPWTFDPNSGVLTEDTSRYDTRLSATLASRIDTTSDDICPGIGGGSPTKDALYSLPAGTKVGSIGDGSTIVSLVAISSDDTKVMYQSRPIPATEAECSSDATPDYFVYSRDTGKATKVSDPVPTLISWKARTGFFAVKSSYDQTKGIYHYSLSATDGTPVVADQQQELSIIAEYVP